MRVFIDWIKLFFVTFIITTIAIALFNFFIDSVGVFGNKSYLSKAAKDLVNGYKIAGLNDYDERVFQELIIKNNKKRVDIIALGSSRAMMIRKRMVTDNKKFFNHSTSRATLEDFIAILGMYKKIDKYLPKEVIIGIDPWIFNKYGGQIRWRSVKEYYFYLLSIIKSKSIQDKRSFLSNKWKQLLNYEYTLKNISYLFHNKVSYYKTSKIESNDSIRDIDDSIYYPINSRGTDKIVENRAKALPLSVNEHSLGKFEEISNKMEFETFIKYLKDNGVKVTLVLFPYHPISYDLFINNPKYAIIQDVEDYLKKFAIDNHIQLIGSYNPHKYNFTNKDFMDGMHGLEVVTERIFKEYRKD